MAQTQQPAARTPPPPSRHDEPPKYHEPTAAEKEAAVQPLLTLVVQALKTLAENNSTVGLTQYAH